MSNLDDHLFRLLFGIFCVGGFLSVFASVVFAIGVVEYFIFEHTYDLLALIVAIVVLAILYAVGTLAEKGVES